MNIDDLKIGDAKASAAMFGSAAQVSAEITSTPVVVCTDKRGVVFGYTTNVEARPIKMTGARMCLYWSADVGGVFGLADKGPTAGCKISATAPAISLEGVTAVFEVTEAAEKAWLGASIQGR